MEENQSITQLADDLITFDIDDNGTPINVVVTINYPFYDVVISGTIKAQLRQDLHSNWFKTTGKMDDYLVQQIGRKISYFITGVWPTNI